VLDVAAVLARPSARVVDLRSPSEFADDHLPGAVNVPLFDDAERSVVGLLYHQDSPERAFTEGLELVEGKVLDLVRDALPDAELPREQVLERTRELAAGGLTGMEARLVAEPLSDAPMAPVVLHCWRGGLRSRSVVALLRQLGATEVVGMQGGYKAYRAQVRTTLEEFAAPPTFVLRGLTGVGKTLVLREVERLRPGWVLDLERAAGHRSSLLGMVGLEPVSQKTFDSRLAARVRAGFDGAMVVEGESRKVGDVIIPAAVWGSLGSGTNLLLEADVPRRVEVLLEDYLADPSARPRLREQLLLVQERMGGPAVDLVGLFDGGREAELVERLLADYYDPLYRHSETGKAYAARIDASDPAKAAARVVELIESP
jgi:tRNA 2-selenouridine synthase